MTSTKKTHATPISIPLFAKTQQALLLREHEAEKLSSDLAASSSTTFSPSTRRSLQASGSAINGLLLEQFRTGMGGRIVGEFGPDPAVISSSSLSSSPSGIGDDGKVRLGSHGIRVGDVVRVMEISSGSGGRKGGLSVTRGKDNKDKDKGDNRNCDGVVIKVTDQKVAVTFGQSSAGDSSKLEDTINELWGKKLWL
jgi:DNA polymerase alpha-associated DNA helicase A